MINDTKSKQKYSIQIYILRGCNQLQALIEYCTFHEKCPRSQLASNTFPNSYLSSLISRFLIPILSTGCLKKVANIIIGPEALPKLCAVGPSFASDITWEHLILKELGPLCHLQCLLSTSIYCPLPQMVLVQILKARKLGCTQSVLI